MKNDSEGVLVSALFDGEIEALAIKSTIGKACKASVVADPDSGSGSAAISDWQMYALIGDRLRGEPPISAGFAAKVMADIRQQPVVLSPGRVARSRPHHPLLALAASVAGVAVVAWFTFTGEHSFTVPAVALSSPAHGRMASQAALSRATTLFAVPPAPTFARAELSGAAGLARAPDAVPQHASRPDLGEYLVAHHAHASAFHLGDGAQQVRTVSASSQGGRP